LHSGSTAASDHPDRFHTVAFYAISFKCYASHARGERHPARARRDGHTSHGITKGGETRHGTPAKFILYIDYRKRGPLDVDGLRAWKR
jgi:hypothetical protein